MVALERSNFVEQAPTEAVHSVGASIAWCAVTHVGSWRSKNEDAFCVESQAEGFLACRHLIALADGLGGHGHGDVASQTVIKILKDEFNIWTGGSPDHFLDRAVRHANEELFIATNTSPEWNGMQTTLTAIAVERGELAIAHVGDCRLYRISDGHCELLTRDHSVAGDLLKLHLITPEQAEKHPERHHLTRSVGSSPFLQVDMARQKLLRGDTYLLCSDGLWSEVSAENVRDITTKYEPDQACQKLAELALWGAAPDNITAIVFRVTNASPRVVSPWRTVWDKVVNKTRLT